MSGKQPASKGSFTNLVDAVDADEREQSTVGAAPSSLHESPQAGIMEPQSANSGGPQREANEDAETEVNPPEQEATNEELPVEVGGDEQTDANKDVVEERKEKEAVEEATLSEEKRAGRKDEMEEKPVEETENGTGMTRNHPKIEVSDESELPPVLISVSSDATRDEVKTAWSARPSTNSSMISDAPSDGGGSTQLGSGSPHSPSSPIGTSPNRPRMRRLQSTGRGSPDWPNSHAKRANMTRKKLGRASWSSSQFQSLQTNGSLKPLDLPGILSEEKLADNHLRVAENDTSPSPFSSAYQSPMISPRRADAAFKLDNAQEVFEKAGQFADILKEARYAVVLTGNGISLSCGIQPYDSTRGVWALKQQRVLPEIGETMQDSDPSFTHLAISDLVQLGYFKRVISTNIDGLHIRSGVPKESLIEVQGNIYEEECVQCSKVYLRTYDVTVKTWCNPEPRHAPIGSKFTGRICEDPHCVGKLVYTIVDTRVEDEALSKEKIRRAMETVANCDLLFVIGNDLRLKCVSGLPAHMLESSRGLQSPKVVMVNRTESEGDKLASQVSYADSDAYMKELMKALAIKVKKWSARKDTVQMDHDGTRTWRNSVDPGKSVMEKEGKCVIL